MMKTIKHLSVVFVSIFFMLLLNTKSVGAVYDRSKNNTDIYVSKNSVKITVRYQRGFDKDWSSYKWCDVTSFNELPETFTASQCIPVADTNNAIKFVEVGGNYFLSYIAKGDASYADNNITSYTFVVDSENDPVLKSISEGNKYHTEKKYVLLVSTYYCSVRSEENGEYTGCLYTDDDTSTIYSHVVVNTNDLYNGLYAEAINKDVGKEEIKSLITQIEEITNTIVIPIIWSILAMFLIVKGAILGVQIVKSADEPQVRREKIGSLKWMLIGVIIAYGASFVVAVVINFFENIFG